MRFRARSFIDKRMAPLVMVGIAFLCSEGAAGAVEVDTEAELRKAWAAPRTEVIDLGKDIVLRACHLADPIRESPVPIRVIGDGHSIRQACFENRLFRQDGTGFVQLEGVNLSRGGSDGPGAAVTTRGEIRILDSRISKNLAEEPGGGVFSMRRIVAIRSVFTGNLANDDGGALYARRGGVTVRDSVLNGNLVDGSGGAIGSTGDIKIIRSSVDGNITDGDGGAVYTDEDGDVTVVDSSVSGNTADGPGGAIFTLDGDVTVVGSVLNGNRADDRGGAISGESDVTMLRSTVSRNVSEAHAAGGIWARGDLFVAGSTISENSAQGQGGGILGAGEVKLAYTSVLGNTAPFVSNVGASESLEVFGSVIGPPEAAPFSDPVNCKAPVVESHGYSISSDSSCDLDGPADLETAVPVLAELLFNGGLGDTQLPLVGGPAIDRIPKPSCAFRPFGNSREGEQHLAGLSIDLLAPTSSDQRGAPRPFGIGCESGSIEQSGSPLRAKQVGPDPAGLPPVGPAGIDESYRREPLRAGRTGVSDADPPAASVSRAGGPLARTRRVMDAISSRLAPMESSVARYAKWRRCITQVPVSLSGDPDGGHGFVFDEVDGNGAGFRTAFAVDRRPPSDYRFFDFSSTPGCRSATTEPGGTADPASAPAAISANPKSTVTALERRLAKLEARARRVELSASRFDEWESCLTWLPVTEYGDPGRRFGYRWMKGRKPNGFGAAAAIDNSPWDDPDYTLLALSGNDRPGRGDCRGEGAPASATVDVTPFALITRNEGPAERVTDLLRDAIDLAETVEDLVEPNFEFTGFDQCMYTVGMTQYGRADGKRGFAYRDRRGKRSTRPALAMDMFGFDSAAYDFMAFSGEEPPQIECNEDAGGLDTDE